MEKGSMKKIQSNIWEFKFVKDEYGNNRSILWLLS